MLLSRSGVWFGLQSLSDSLLLIVFVLSIEFPLAMEFLSLPPLISSIHGSLLRTPKCARPSFFAIDIEEVTVAPTL